jgi:D-alanyl-D-alanine carboxypeptidase
LAPVHAGQPLGQATVSAKGKALKSIPLLASGDIPQAGFIKRSFHSVVLLARNQGKRLIIVVLLLGGLAGLLLVMRLHRPRRSTGVKR